MDRTTAQSSGTRRARTAALMSGCALALVLAAAPERALAQDASMGFQGTGTVVAGSATIATGAQLTTIEANTANTVINWTPTSTATSGTIDFLPQGYGAEFTTSTLSDYTVLNRILPAGSAKIGINGAIASYIGEGVGGNIWFYTPNGFIIGNTATMSVGGLILTSNDISYSVDATSGAASFTDANGALNFRGGSASGSIVNNGRLYASNYVAMIAPRIEQRGLVDSDGAVGYVAAESVDLTINSGNFDILVNTGTSDTQGIVHTDTTTGLNDGVNGKSISFVAIPKNDALTMLLQGSIGYTPGVEVTTDPTSITITAGQSGSPAGNIDIGTATFQNQLSADATGDIIVRGGGGTPDRIFGYENVVFYGPTQLSGQNSVSVQAGAGIQIQASQGMTLISQNANGSGGKIDVTAAGSDGTNPAGIIVVSGLLELDVAGSGGSSSDGTIGFDSNGGTVNIVADGGAIDAGSVAVYATAFGGSGSTQGGDGTGGTVNIKAGHGGSIYSGDLFVNANAEGGQSFDFSNNLLSGGTGGTGRGGSITISDSVGSVADDPNGGLLALGSLGLYASGSGGTSGNPSPGFEGDGFGGDIALTFDRQDQSFGSVTGYAQAYDGGAILGAVGGDITLDVGGGVSVAMSNVYFDTSAATSTGGPAGAFVRGGTIGLSVTGGSTLDIQYSLDLNADADTFVGLSGRDRTPDATGGTITVLADGGTLRANAIYAGANAYALAADTTAGKATGGTIVFEALNDGQVRAAVDSEFSGGSMDLLAEAYGESGAAPAAAEGGAVTLNAGPGGTLAAESGTIAVSVRAFGNGFSETTAGDGADASGGTVNVNAIGGGIESGLFLEATGNGGFADGNGGNGTGGTIAVLVQQDGSLADSFYATAEGFGGRSLVKGDGGDGRGGNLTLATDPTAVFGPFDLQFYGYGRGGRATSGQGGDGYGGTAKIDILGLDFDWNAIALYVGAEGSFSEGTGSIAGSAFASPVGATIHIGQGSTFGINSILIDNTATASANGGANIATGGMASVLIDGGSSVNTFEVSLDSSASLTDGEIGGDSIDTSPTATGGSSSLIVDGANLGLIRIDLKSNGQTSGAMTAAGEAHGGNATLGVLNGGKITVAEATESTLVRVEARGLGGEGPSAADAFGGTATIYTAGGSISVPRALTANADAEAGNFSSIFEGVGIASNGFNATGGTASIEMRAGGGGGGSIDAPKIHAHAIGAANSGTAVSRTGGIGIGGTAIVSVAQGTLTSAVNPFDVGDIYIDANGYGGSAGVEAGGGTAYQAGSGTGGNASFTQSGGTVSTTQLSIYAQGIGADQTFGDGTASISGSGTGGTALFRTSGGTLNDSGAISVYADADGNGATGGTAAIELLAGAGTVNAASLYLGATADGYRVDEAGDGGDALGGTARLSVADGSLVTGSIGAYTNARGGQAPERFGSTTPYQSGTGQGGTSAFYLSGGSVQASSIDLYAEAIGADGVGITAGATGSLAAAGTGGTALFSASGGTLNATGRMTLWTYGYGGDGAYQPGTGPGGDGATGTGGTSAFIAPAGSTANLIIAGPISLDAIGYGGTGFFSSTGPRGRGGDGVGGTAMVALSDLAFDLPGMSLSAFGGGTAGTPRGDGIGGTASFSLVDTGAGPGTPRSIAGLSLNADGVSPPGYSGTVTFDAKVGSPASALTILSDLSLRAVGDFAQSGSGVFGTITGAPVTVNGRLFVNTTGNSSFSISNGGALDMGGNIAVNVGGSFTATGPMSTKANASFIAPAGISLTDLTVGGTTLLRAVNGPVTVSNNLTSGGLVTAFGTGVNIYSLGALSFADLDATAGDVLVQTAGDLTTATVDATGAVTLRSTGGTVHTTGAVNGVNLTFIAAGDVISDTNIAATGNLTVDAGGVFSTPSPNVSATGNVSLSAGAGLNLASVTSGGTTFLGSTGGPITVSQLTSAGLVTAIGRSVTLASSGSLSFADAQATAGNLSIATAGNLAVAKGSATGSIALSSSQGTVTGAGPLISGGAFSADGAAGVSLGTVSSGAATTLNSAGGDVSVTDLASVGKVTATGNAVTIGSSGALSFANAQAKTGALNVTTAGNLFFDQASAAGAMNLASTGGSLGASGPVTAGGNVTASGAAGIAFNSLVSGGTTSLTSASGPVSVSSLTSPGAVTASGTSLFIASPGALTFADARATSGALTIQTAGAVALQQASAAGAMNVTSTGSTVTATGPLSAGGNVAVSGQGGVSLGTLSSGGTTSLTSSGGAVAVSGLTSAGLVTASGTAVTIGSPGALSFANAQATSGALSITTAGNLALQQASAADTLSLTSTGGTITGTGPISSGGALSANGVNGVALATVTSGGTTALTASNGTIQVGNLNSAGQVTAAGRSVAIGSTGALSFADLDATAGNIAVQTAGNLTVNTVDATGSVTLASTNGALNANGMINGANIALSSAASLALTQALSTPGTLRLTSTGGSVSTTGALASGGNLTVSGQAGISLGTATSGGTTTLVAANGAVQVANLNSVGAVTAAGRSVTIGSSGALSFADLDATAGNVAVQTAGNLAVNTVDATGTVTLTSTGGALTASGPINGNGVSLSSAASLALSQALSTPGALSLTSTGGSVSATGALNAGGNLSVSGQTGIALGAATSGGTTALSAPAGAVQVTNLNSAGAVTAAGRSVTIGSSGALTFADLDAIAGNVAVTTAGNLTVNTIDATGSIALTSTGGTLAVGGAINGVGVALSSANTLALTQALSTSGALSLTSTNGSVTASSPISAGGNLAVSGLTGIALGSATSGGTTSLAAATGAVQVTNLNSVGAVTAAGRSVTIGSTGALSFADLDATAGNVAVQTAGNLAVNTVDATGSVTLTSTGGALTASGPINGNGVALSSAASLALSQAQSTPGALSLTSTGGSVSSTGAVGAGGNLTVSGQTGIALAAATSGGTAALTAPTGTVQVANLNSAGAVTAAGRSVTIGSSGALTFADLDATAGNVAVTTAGNLTVATVDATGSATLASTGGDVRNTGLVNAAGISIAGTNVTADAELRSSGALSLTAGQLLTVNAQAAGTTVATKSADIAIGTSGRLGRRGLTTALTIANQSAAQPMAIGGTGATGAFSLDKTEATRLFADQQIAFVQAASTQGTFGDVTIGDLAMGYGATANVGGGGLIKVDANGRVEVNGAIALATSTSGDRFSIDPTRIDVIAGSGSIVMKDGSGALLGQLELTANTIAVADKTTLDTIAALSDFAAISKALDKPGPAGPAGGYLQAGTITFAAGDALYIQNAGATTAYDDRRGFLAGSVAITTTNAAPRIAVNGAISTAGGLLTGLKTAEGVTINGVAATTIPVGATITINGCAAGVNCGIPAYTFGGLSDDELEKLFAAAEENGDGPTGRAVQIESNEPLITPPLVDEPITGVGNDDLWQVHCEVGDDKAECPSEGQGDTE